MDDINQWTIVKNIFLKTVKSIPAQPPQPAIDIPPLSPNVDLSFMNIDD